MPAREPNYKKLIISLRDCRAKLEREYDQAQKDSCLMRDIKTLIDKINITLLACERAAGAQD